MKHHQSHVASRPPALVAWKLLFGSILGLGLASGLALTISHVTFVCPIDDHSFSAGSFTGTAYGSRLDYKPIGALVAPWPLTQCPQCKFVFGWRTNDTATLARLRPVVLSDAYKSEASNGPTYLCLARLREALKAPPLEIADAYLKASWQVEDVPERNRTYLQAALTNYLADAKSWKVADAKEDCVSYDRLCAELERRLGRFDEARTRVIALKRTTTDREELAILDRLLGFINQKDTAPHAATEDLEARVTRKPPPANR